MLIFIMKRLSFMVLTMFVVSVLLFVLLEINVDGVAVRVLGPYSDPESREIWLQEHGYREPLVKRYLNWLGNAVAGNFGESVRFKVPVSEVLWPRLWNTAILGFWVFAFLIPISLVLGILAGMREGS
ncbi:MAG: ABC transporter permease, partial [Acidiferrobacterales bacterium]